MNDPLHQAHGGDEEEDQYGFVRRDKDEMEKPAADEKPSGHRSAPGFIKKAAPFRFHKAACHLNQPCQSLPDLLCHIQRVRRQTCKVSRVRECSPACTERCTSLMSQGQSSRKWKNCSSVDSDVARAKDVIQGLKDSTKADTIYIGVTTQKPIERWDMGHYKQWT